jgi:hypothetical protein
MTPVVPKPREGLGVCGKHLFMDFMPRNYHRLADGVPVGALLSKNNETKP